MSIKLSNTGGKTRLARSTLISQSESTFIINHYVNRSGYLSPVYYNFRNQFPKLLEEDVGRTAQIGAISDDILYQASIRVSVRGLGNIDIDVKLSFILPALDWRQSSLEVLSPMFVDSFLINTELAVKRQVEDILKNLTSPKDFWFAINDYLKQEALLNG